jgi:ABC-2 type transport system ATP-binding protein
MYRGYYPTPRPLDEIIQVVGLDEKRDERVVRLSGGQKRRLDVAIGLAGDPELLFLDEPTAGFDPAARRQMWDAVRHLRTLGKTVVLTTHYMEEAQQLADRVAVIAKGKIVAEGPPGTLAGRDAAATIVRFKLDQDAPTPPVGATVNGVVEVTTEDPTRTLYELTGWALNNKVELHELSVARPTLEDTYLTLTGEMEGAQ